MIHKKPRIKIQGIDNGRSYSKPVKIQVDVKDQNLNPDKTYIYLNGKKMNSVMIKKDGYYTIDVKTEDLAGNQNRCSRKFTVNQKGIQIHSAGGFKGKTDINKKSEARISH